MSGERAAQWKQAEALFAESPAYVIAVSKVQKCSAGVALLAKQKRLPRGTGKTRLVVLTGVWDQEASRMQLAVHSCKPMGTAFKVNKSYPINTLVKLEVYQGEPGVLDKVHALELTFHGANSESRLAVQTQEEDILLQILAPLWRMIMKFPAAEQKRPGLVTYPNNTVSLVVQMEAWIANHLDPDIEKRLYSLAHGSDDDKDGEEDERGRLSLVSAKEERDLQALLDRFALEVGDMDDFQNRLQAELAALEAANVHGILGSTANVERVKVCLTDALGLLEDVNENLATLDTKLLFMREDIAAIEARNNNLELQTRNNGKLLTVLDGLLEKLQLPPTVERALQDMQFTEASLEIMVKAGWCLYKHLEALSEAEPGAAAVGGISPPLAAMHAVAQQRVRFALLAKAYAGHAEAFIAKRVAIAAESALRAAATHRGAVRCAVPSHSELREQTETLAPLLHVVKSLRPDVLDSLSKHYTLAINTLLRKELRSYTADIRRCVASAISHHPPEPVLLKSHRREEGRVRNSPHSGLRDCLHLRDKPVSGSFSSSDSAPSSPTTATPSTKDSDLQPHQGYAQLLRHWIPLLFDELDSCADFLMLREDGAPASSQDSHEGKSSPSGKSPSKVNGANFNNIITSNGSSGAKGKSTQLIAGGIDILAALIADVSSDFLAVVDLASRQQQFQAIPMLATTLAWNDRLAETPLAAPLISLLTQCCKRLLSNFDRFMKDTVASVQRFEGKSSLSLADGVKGVHILPYVPNFATIVARLQELQEEAEIPPEDFLPLHPGEPDGESDDENDEEHLHQTQDREESLGEQDFVREDTLQIGNPAGWRRGSAGFNLDSDALRKHLKKGAISQLLQRAPGMGLRRAQKRTQPLLETMDSLAESAVATPAPTSTALTEAEIPVQLPELRLIRTAGDVTDAVFAIFSKAMFSSIEKIAATDTKHGERLRMENFLLYNALMGPFASDNLVLAYFVAVASASKEHATQVYVQHQLEYARMWKIAEFSQGIDQRLQEVSAEEVPFQPGFQASDLRNLLSTSVHNCEKRLSELHTRIMKHLRGDSDLVDLVWHRLRMKLESNYRKLEQQAARLYPSVQLPMTADALRAILVTVG